MIAKIRCFGPVCVISGFRNRGRSEGLFRQAQDKTESETKTVGKLAIDQLSAGKISKRGKGRMQSFVFEFRRMNAFECIPDILLVCLNLPDDVFGRLKGLGSLRCLQKEWISLCAGF